MTGRANLTNRKKRGATEAIFFVIVMSLMLAVFWNQEFFPTDEGEIFVKGQAIARGALLYRDVASQHMPVMYYIAAFFSLLGISTITGFRLSFFFLMAVLWGLMYIKYRKEFGRCTMILYPMLYVLILPTIEFGTTILSEQFAGIGLTILMFELLHFQRVREIRLDNCCMISLGVFLSFGTAFVTIFAIFSICVTVLLLEIRDCQRSKIGIGKSVQYLAKRYWRLICIVMLPWVILLSYYTYTHTMDDFYGWAYLLNRLIYPKYISSHYGSNIIYAFFCGIGNIIGEFEIQELTIARLTQLALLLMTVVFYIYCWREKRDAIYHIILTC